MESDGEDARGVTGHGEKIFIGGIAPEITRPDLGQLNTTIPAG
jgi:hypothetical protein